jgi:hypothetical protein
MAKEGITFMNSICVVPFSSPTRQPGPPVLLSQEEMAEVMERFRHYGAPQRVQ